MLVHTYILASKVNGPGTRFTLWVQGCSRHCVGCFNPDTWPTSGSGTYMSVEEIISYIPAQGIDGITVSGGEPFDQSEELTALLKLAHKKDLETLVYTGYTYEQLYALEDKYRALCEVDILIDGPYMQNVPSQNIWAGSGNQHVYRLKKGIRIRDITNKVYESAVIEILIDKQGTITTTGLKGNILKNSDIINQSEEL